MLNKIIYTIFFLIILGLFSCEEKDQITDAPKQLFRPALFQYDVVNGNEVYFSWIPIKGAKHYSLELARDSFHLTNEVLIFVVEDRLFKVEDLWSNTQYFARIKSVSENTEISDSEYKEITFVTKTENIFYSINSEDVGQNNVLLKWNAIKNVSHIVVSNETTDIATIVLTQEEIAVGEKNISGLISGNKYIFKIFYGEMLRGTISVTTN
jgi:hypothetical protein